MFLEFEKEFKVLDKGFIRYVDHMGNDSSVVQSARVSYGRGTKTSLEDEGLIRYLMRMSHSTPFEAAVLKLHVKCPIFVARQWHRHRSFSYNEYSARYSVVDNDYYLPLTERIVRQSQTNKQGSSVDGIIEEDRETLVIAMKQINEQTYKQYQKALEQGLTREVARINLTQAMFTEFYVSGSLHNWFHFCNLRADDHAQYEIRVYAEVILNDIIAKWVPMSYRAFLDYKMNSKTFSAPVLKLLEAKLKGQTFTFETCGLSKREWDENKEWLT